MNTSALVINANSLKIPLADQSVHCVVTSPPYYGMRDYGTAHWEGGDPECDHKQATARYDGGRSNVQGFHGSTAASSDKGALNYRQVCAKCGARRIDDQIGLEDTVEQYTAHLVEVFREVWRVLRDDGTAWLNLGDSYATNPGNGRGGETRVSGGIPHRSGIDKRQAGLKNKDLIGVPWRVAFALQADGWYLRSGIIWYKTNPMPESTPDRPTNSYENVFLLTKKERYFYDAEAIKEPSAGQHGTAADFKRATKEALVPGQASTQHRTNRAHTSDSGWRNKRNVWVIATQPTKDAHFATYPQKLVEPCILAGTSAHGVCPICGAPWMRIVKKPDMRYRPTRSAGSKDETAAIHLSNGWAGYSKSAGQKYQAWRNANPDTTVGWRPGCSHDAQPVPAIVFDPFTGTGTTGIVARRLGRSFVGVDLSFTYLSTIASRRLSLAPLEAWRAGAAKPRHPAAPGLDDLPLFDRSAR